VARLAGNPKVEIRFPVLPVTRRSFRRATFVAGCSAGASGSIGDHLGVPASRIRTLPNIVDVAGVVSASRRGESASDPQRPFVFVHAGRLVAQKNQELLLRALAAMKHREAELWMLGTGPKSRQLQRWAHRLGVAERVRWLGFQPELHGVMAGGNAFVLSSRYEGLPNVVIEAMLAGLPVVSTDCPFGPSELIEPGRTGYLVPTGDGAALASAMDQMVEIGPEEARRWGEQARRSMMERFDPDKILPMYVDLLEHAAREGSP
jgi:glycosyltransferase involved in cell wall biosynthesis